MLLSWKGQLWFGTFQNAKFGNFRYFCLRKGMKLILDYFRTKGSKHFNYIILTEQNFLTFSLSANLCSIDLDFDVLKIALQLSLYPNSAKESIRYILFLARFLLFWWNRSEILGKTRKNTLLWPKSPTAKKKMSRIEDFEKY